MVFAGTSPAAAARWAVAGLALLAAALLGPARGEGAGPPGPLASLRVAGGGAMFPAFDPDVFHYGVRCAERQALSVSAAVRSPGARLALNGGPWTAALEDAAATLAEDEDLVVAVEAPGTEGHTAYVVHCVPLDFPEAEVLRKEAGTAPGLLLVTPYHTPNGPDRETESWLAVLDDNGVPRFARRSSPPAHNFRWHASARRFSYNKAPPNGAGEVVLLDERLSEVGRVSTVGGLAPAMMHEFLITDEGTYLFIAKNPAVRDLSRYPGPDEGPAPAAAQETHDAVIQEVAPDGREVFRWNSWPHLKLSDCAGWRFFPEEYAKLNALHLDGAGNLLASVQGCSQALKIERPSGRVLWQLGGSDPALPDAYDGRRQTFERPWHRPQGDPHGGFCAQHTVLEPAPGRILLFDNGRCADGGRESSRTVEYRLGADGEAAFAGQHEPGWLTMYGGAVALLANGNRLIAWGGGTGPASVTEVDAAGRELFALRFSSEDGPVLMTYRAYRHTGPQPPLRPPAATGQAEAP